MNEVDPIDDDLHGGVGPGIALVKTGHATVTIVVPPDGSLQAEAGRVVQAIHARHQVTPVVIAGDRALQQMPTPHAIVLGCLADNPLVQVLYQRWHCLVDRWYPGSGGWVVQTIRSPLRRGEHVVLLGGSDATGVELAVSRFVEVLEAVHDEIHDADNSATIQWQLEVELSEGHLPLPADRIDVLGTSASPVVTPEATLPTGPYESGFTVGPAHQHLLRLGMYGPHADNYHLSRSSQFGLRYLYTGRPDDAQLYRDTLLSEVRSGSVAKLYHYKSIRMFQLWDLLEPLPFFTDEERGQINGALRAYLLDESGVASIEMIQSVSITTGIFSRHHACDALNLWIGADWLWRQTGDSRWLADRAVADAYFVSQAGTDVPLTGLTEGYASYLEVVLEWMLLSCPERIADDPHIQLWARRVRGLCTNMGQLVIGPQTDGSRYPYHLLRRLAFLLADGRFLFAADLRERQVHAGMDRALQFSAGQAWAGDVEACEPVNDIGLTIYPLNERLRNWQAPSILPERGFDRAIARGGWAADDDYLIVIGVRSGGKALPNVGAIAAYERFGQHLITSDAVPLFPHSASAWRHSSVTVGVGGLGFGMAPGAQILVQREIAGGQLFAFEVIQGTLHWTRQIYWQPAAWLFVVDRVMVEDDGQALSASTNWRCGGALLGIEGCLATLSLGSLAAGRFFVEVSEGLGLGSEHNTYPAIGAPPGTPPHAETMLHATPRAHSGEAFVEMATLMHAVETSNDPQVRLGGRAGHWAIEGGHETHHLIADGEAGLAIDIQPQRDDRGPAGPAIQTGRQITASTGPDGRSAIDDDLPVTDDTAASGHPACTLPVCWSCELPGAASTWAQADDGALAIGTDRGDVIVLDTAGRLRSASTCTAPVTAPVTALCFLGSDLLVGTSAGLVCRLDDNGATRWRYQCQFRPERTFYPYWFLQTPTIGALAAGQDPASGRDLIAAGTGSTSLNFLDATTGDLIEDVLSPYGLPDRIRSHLSADGSRQFLVGHSWLTCGSTVRAWSVSPTAQEGIRYNGNVDAMGRSGGDWDSCGVVDFWMGSLAPELAEVVIVLRHGSVNQITLYDETTGDPLWDATLGGSPIGLAVVPGDDISTARCWVADQFGSLVSFDGTGMRTAATRLASSLTGMRATNSGHLTAWNAETLYVDRQDIDGRAGDVAHHDLVGAPLGWWEHQQATGILCVEDGRLVLREVALD